MEQRMHNYILGKTLRNLKIALSQYFVMFLFPTVISCRSQCYYDSSVTQHVVMFLIIHQIFSLARDWSKRVTLLNMPQLKLGNSRVIFPSFRIAKNVLKMINTIAPIWLKKYARIFVLGHYLFLEAHSFPRASLSRTVRFPEQIMSADKYRSIFSRQMETIVYI